MSEDAYKIRPVVFDGGGPAKSVDFNYDAIDGYDFTEQGGAWESAGLALRKLLDWIDDTRDDRGKVIRLQAVKGLLYGRNQVELAREIGVTKAAISQMSVKFRDTFNFNHARNIRTEQTRKEFSEQCKQRHQQRRQRSESEESDSNLSARTLTTKPEMQTA